MKSLKDILKKTSTQVQPYNKDATSPASKTFLSKHSVEKTEDANDNGDEVFNASHVNTFDRSSHHYGNNAEQSAAVYEAKSCGCDDKKSLKKILKGKLEETKKLSRGQLFIARQGKKINPKNDENEIDSEDFKALRMQKEETLEEGFPDPKSDAKLIAKHFDDVKKVTKKDVKKHLEKMMDDRDTRGSYETSDDYTSDVMHHIKKMQKESTDIKSMLIDISNKTKELANIVNEEEIEAWNEIDDYVSSLYDDLMDKVDTMKEQEVKQKSIMEKAPPGQKAESFIMKNKSSFKKRYGDRWEKVLYATAHKIFGKGK